MSERGSGTLLASLVILVVAGLTALAILWAVFSAQGHRLQGAADLAAVAGASRQLSGADACAGARESASLNEATVTECRVAGDEVEFVVTVHVVATAGWAPWTREIRAHANAGVVTGSQP